MEGKNLREVASFVSEKLGGKEPESFDKVDPMTCVAQGAAIVAAILQGAPGLDNHAYSVKLEHSLCANPIMAAGLIRFGEAAQRIIDGRANRAVAHATSGACLQQNIVTVLEGE